MLVAVSEKFRSHQTTVELRRYGKRCFFSARSAKLALVNHACTHIFVLFVINTGHLGAQLCGIICNWM